MKTALVIGATGLVGKALLDQLLVEEEFDQVKIFTRRDAGFKHKKLVQHLIDFDDPESWEHLVKGDVLFSALGTTRKKAGGKKAQYLVDYTYQYRFAAAAAGNSVGTMVLVSSAGASLKSPFFYSRMKAELEKDVKVLGFDPLVIIRPGPLEGPREENRPGEKIGIAVTRFAAKAGIAKKYRPIHADIVARAMINATKKPMQETSVFELQEVFDLADTF